MRPKRCVVDYFGSYEHAEISFDNLGLTLISGPTGAGKSTIADFVAWGLFGITSKNGAADDVRAWGSDQPTKVVLDVELPDGSITVTRIRGKQTQNDLSWVEGGDTDHPKRGKDMAETQRLLEKRLGVDAELFLLGAYFDQFSASDKFFTSKPTQRREVLERITDLTLAIQLSDKSSEARKVAKKELEGLESNLTREQGRTEQVMSQIASVEKASKAWEAQQAQKLEDARQKSANFEVDQTAKIEKLAAEIEALTGQVQTDESIATTIEQIRCEQDKLTGYRAKYQKSQGTTAELRALLALAEREYSKIERMKDVCPECSRPGAAPDKEKHLGKCKQEIDRIQEALTVAKREAAALEKKLSEEQSLNTAMSNAQRAQMENERLKDRIEASEKALVALDAAVNPYKGQVEQLETAVNPYVGQHHDLGLQAVALKGSIARLEELVAEKSHRVASLSSIYDLSFALRGELLQNAVGQLERETNGNLTEYFDGVFQVAFTLEGSDKLEVEVLRDEHSVSFTSLSGGERRQLVLSFWRALSKRAWECAGTSSSLLVLDEAFSGLDDSLKQKAFRMLEDMSDDFESILVIDHSPAFQVNFSNVIEVTKQGENSEICLEREGIKEAA